MICKLTIVAGIKEGKCYLKDTFFTHPFKMADVGQYQTDKSLYLMIMSSSPGLLDGDQYNISIKTEAGSRLQLQSQSYQRLYNMQEGASQKVQIELEPGSSLSFVSHPIVPHENSKFKSHTKVYLEDNCELVLTEIITCGRKHSGEIFRFTYFQNLTEIYLKNKLILKDNILLKPDVVPPETIGQWEEFTHQGTFIYINTDSKPIHSIIGEVQLILAKEKGLNFGISEMAANGFVLRILANGGEQIFNCFKRIQEKLWNTKPADKQSISEKKQTVPS
jgi:urease accessory protein